MLLVLCVVNRVQGAAAASQDHRAGISEAGLTPQPSRLAHALTIEWWIRIRIWRRGCRKRSASTTRRRRNSRPVRILLLCVRAASSPCCTRLILLGLRLVYCGADELMYCVCSAEVAARKEAVMQLERLQRTGDQVSGCFCSSALLLFCACVRVRCGDLISFWCVDGHCS